MAIDSLFIRFTVCIGIATGALALPRAAAAQVTMGTAMPTYDPGTPPDTSWKIKARKTPATLKVTALDGSVVDLAAFRGKVVALEFYELLHCDECVAQEEALKAAYAKYHAKGFEIVRVVIGDSGITNEMLQQEAKENGVTWPATFTPSQIGKSAIMDQYGIKYLPAPLVVFDKKGLFVSNTMKASEIDGYLARTLKP